MYEQDVIHVEKHNRFDKMSTSKGNQTKWFKDNMFIKADSMGYESISEALVADLLRYVEDIEFVDYFMCKIIEDDCSFDGCYSCNCLEPDEEMVSVYRILQSYGFVLSNGSINSKGQNLFDFVCKTISEITKLDMYKYISDLVKIDYITRNEDRHLNNICVIMEPDGSFRYAPVFDNGLSLLSDITDYPLDKPTRDLMRKVHSKPFSSKFDKQFQFTDMKPLVIDYSSFLEDLRSSYVDFKEKEFNRAKQVLSISMKALEGIVWIQK